MTNWVMKAATVFSLLAMASVAPSYGRDATHSTCPKGYSPLGEICLDKGSGDIVLPTRKKTGVSVQTITAR
jgi:hypothetical protein